MLSEYVVEVDCFESVDILAEVDVSRKALPQLPTF